MDILPAHKKKHVTIHERLDEMDGVYRQRIQALYERLRKGDLESTADISNLIDEFLAALLYDIIDSKKADALFKGLGLKITVKKEFLNVDFPAEVLRQVNETVVTLKTNITKAHKELLCPTCYQKVSEKLGWD